MQLVGIQIYNLDIARIKNQRNEISMYYFSKLKFGQKLALIERMLASPCDRLDSHPALMCSMTNKIYRGCQKNVYTFLRELSMHYFLKLKFAQKIALIKRMQSSV